MTKKKSRKEGTILGDIDVRLRKSVLLEANIKEQLNKLFYEKPDYDAELEMMDFQYSQEEEERVGLHASSIISAGKGFCFREQVLSLFFRQAQGENIDIRLKRIFEEGKSIGTKWQRLFIRGGIADKEDLDVSRMAEEYDLSYTPDAIIRLNNKRYVVEIKSMNTFQFKKTERPTVGIKQLKLYMYFEGIEQGFTLIEDKNDQDFKVILVTDVNESDPDIADALEILEKIQVYKKKFIKTKKPPKRIPECDSSTCKRAMRCNMREACWGIRRERIK